MNEDRKRALLGSREREKLSGKVALMTGGSHGLNQGIALAQGADAMFSLPVEARILNPSTNATIDESGRLVCEMGEEASTFNATIPMTIRPKTSFDGSRQEVGMSISS